MPATSSSGPGELPRHERLRQTDCFRQTYAESVLAQIAPMHCLRSSVHRFRISANGTHSDGLVETVLRRRDVFLLHALVWNAARTCAACSSTVLPLPHPEMTSQCSTRIPS